MTDRACTGGIAEAIIRLDVDPTTTSKIVVALGMITKAEPEVVVNRPVRPGTWLFFGTSTEPGSTKATVVGAVVELDEVDEVVEPRMKLDRRSPPVRADSEEMALLDNVVSISAVAVFEIIDVIDCKNRELSTSS